tara:strand:+ start:242 stop:775 length:534 start_codon:yes stop_codon:yes gene_type:complete
MTLIRVKGSSITGALAAVDGSALTGLSAGKVVKIHSTHPSLSEQTFQTTTFTTVTGLSLTITPASSSSKFLLQTGLQYRLRSSSSSNQPNFAIRFQRDGSQIYKTNNYTFGMDVPGTQTGTFLMGIAQFNYVDAPSTASQIVYSVGVRTETDGGADIVDINDDGGDGSFLYAIEYND